MRIALINGSPKLKKSASGALISDFCACAHGRCECEKIKMNKTEFSEDTLGVLAECDAWVFFYPTYVDGAPGHLLSCLEQLQKTAFNGAKRIYAVSNCGFHDGQQCEWALDIIKHWSSRAGHKWGGGLGIGGGGALTKLLRLKSGARPKSRIDKSLNCLLEDILANREFEKKYSTVSLPRGIYKMCAELSWWYGLRCNGKRKRDIGIAP